MLRAGRVAWIVFPFCMFSFHTNQACLTALVFYNLRSGDVEYPQEFASPEDEQAWIDAWEDVEADEEFLANWGLQQGSSVCL